MRADAVRGADGTAAQRKSLTPSLHFCRPAWLGAEKLQRDQQRA